MNEKYNRETVGKLSVEAMQKPLETTDAREQGGKMTENYMKELFKAIEEGKKEHEGDFFAVVLTKSERALKNVIRNFFFHRSTCPTPDYDQAVYHYKKLDDKVDFLWVIPSREFTFHIKDNALTLDEEYKELRSFVLDFSDGTLSKKAMLLNNEDVLIGKAILKVIDGTD